MAKICKSCGKEYTGDWCPHCGYGDPNLKTKAADKYKKNTKPVRFMTEEEKAEYYAEQAKSGKKIKKPSRKAIRIITASVCVAIVTAIALFVLYKQGIIFDEGDPSEVAKSYFTAINDRDFDAFLDCVPPAISDAYEEEVEELGIEDGAEFDTLYSDIMDAYGDDFKIETEFGRQSEVDDDTISDYEDTYEELYDKSINVKKAYKYSVTATISGSEGSDVAYYEVYVARFGGSWYVVDAAVVTTTISADEEESTT